MTFGNNMMSSHEAGSVSLSFTLSFLEFARLQGADLPGLQARANVSLPDPPNDDARISIDDFLRVLQTAKSMTGRPGLALEFASKADFSETSIAGLIANSAPTMLDALIQLNRYGKLALDVPFRAESSLRFERGSQTDTIVDQRRLAPTHTALRELTFTYLITGPRRFLPKAHILAVELTYPRPSYASFYEQIWQVPIRFDAPRNALKLPKWVADHPVRLQPEYVFGILTHHADEMLAKLDARADFAAMVERLMMADLHTGSMSVELIAAKLGLSRQTIYRRLKADGWTFAELLDRVRYTLAVEYLSRKRVTVAETAFLLGYSDPSAFSRAFKRWTGHAPADYKIESTTRSEK